MMCHFDLRIDNQITSNTRRLKVKTDISKQLKQHCCVALQCTSKKKILILKNPQHRVTVYPSNQFT